MKNTLLLISPLILFLTSCSADVTPNTLTLEMLPLPEYLIGSWEGSREVSTSNETHLEEYSLVFHTDDTLRFRMTSPTNDFDAKFSYKFIDSNTLLVENDRSKGDTWKIRKIGNGLEICRGSSVIICVEYFRAN